MTRTLILAPLALASAAMLPTPAFAQEEGGDTVNMVIIYGEDSCPQSTPEEIVVCRRYAEDERYRIPQNLRTSEDPANESWTQRVESYEMVGDFGTLSCSPSGAGGELGCTQKMIDAAYKERATDNDVRFSQLIEEERQKRLATIDEDAAAEQARVEAIEREYMERLERERQADLPGESDALPDPAAPEPN